mmetsp:Transcript_2706/g.9852  ORF Transcript_2706/g.9852 Transcript_2706/m.9852 type:complete len:388 (-) Transcript_2706:16-1179(-)
MNINERVSLSLCVSSPILISFDEAAFEAWAALRVLLPHLVPDALGEEARAAFLLEARDAFLACEVRAIRGEEFLHRAHRSPCVRGWSGSLDVSLGRNHGCRRRRRRERARADRAAALPLRRLGLPRHGAPRVVLAGVVLRSRRHVVRRLGRVLRRRAWDALRLEMLLLLLLLQLTGHVRAWWPPLLLREVEVRRRRRRTSKRRWKVPHLLVVLQVVVRLAIHHKVVLVMLVILMSVVVLLLGGVEAVLELRVRGWAAAAAAPAQRTRVASRSRRAEHRLVEARRAVPELLRHNHVAFAVPAACLALGPPRLVHRVAVELQRGRAAEPGRGARSEARLGRRRGEPVQHRLRHAAERGRPSARPELISRCCHITHTTHRFFPVTVRARI